MNPTGIAKNMNLNNVAGLGQLAESVDRLDDSRNAVIANTGSSGVVHSLSESRVKNRLLNDITASGNSHMTTSSDHQFGPDHLRPLTPYPPGLTEAQIAKKYGIPEEGIVKLASNENPLGMSRLAKVAIRDFIEGKDAGRYPDDTGLAVKQALVENFGLPHDANPFDWITLGAGSSEIIGMLVKGLSGGPKDSVMYSQHSFALYPLHTKTNNATPIEVPANGFGHDLDAMLKALTPETKLIFVANPNNPTGTFIPEEKIKNFLNKVPKDVVVVLDEAYSEYVKPEDKINSSALVLEHDNLAVLKTFSKAYGLANLRIGYCVAQPKLTKALNKGVVRPPFNTSAVAQKAAIAALGDQQFLKDTVALNTAGYEQLTQAFNELGLDYQPSQANFVLVKVGDDPQASKRIDEKLKQQGVIVRQAGFPHHLRVSIGKKEENDAFIAALKKALTN